MKLLQSSTTEELANLHSFDLKIVFTRDDQCFSQRKLPEKNYKPSKIYLRMFCNVCFA